MSDKGFKAIDQQLEILRSRGLAINDENAAREFLLLNNYYRISGYSLTLRTHDVFHKGSTFQDIVDIYSFDHRLRHILLKYIEIIEVNIKSVYAYEFTKRHGATGYLDRGFFTDVIKHDEIIQKAEQQKLMRLPHEAYLKHFIEDLQQDVPLWAYVDLLTISDISFLYKISENDIQDAVALDLGLSVRGSDILKAHLHSITIIRNLCAHGSRLYNRLFEQKPWLSKREKSLLIKDNTGDVDNSHLFSFIIVMHRLLKQDEFNAMKNEIIELCIDLPFVKMRYYGFPENWASLM